MPNTNRNLQPSRQPSPAEAAANAAEAAFAPNGLKRVEVRLVGEDGNAFAIIGRTLAAMRRAGWSVAERAAFSSAACSGDYHHLLATVMEYTVSPDDESIDDLARMALGDRDDDE